MNTVKKKRVGLVVAIEMDAINDYYPDLRELPSPLGFKAYFVEREAFELYICRTGIGEIFAAAGVQYLISQFGVTTILNFGVVGGLTHAMSKHQLCLVNRVVHYKYDCSEFMELAVGQVDGHDSIYLSTDETLSSRALTLMNNVPCVTCCSGDKFIGTEEEKKYLHNTFGGDICDMESAGIVLTCEANAVPCLMLKAVSDGLSEGAQSFFDALYSASLSCLKVLGAIIDQL